MQDTGVNLEEEAAGMSAVSLAAPRAGSAVLQDDLLLNEAYITRVVMETTRRFGLTANIPEMHRYLSQCFEAHLVPILERAHRVAQHRLDPSRRAAGMVQVEDMRRKVLFMEKEERTKAEAKEEAEREQLLKEAAEKKGKADEETQEKVKKVKAAEHEKRAKSDANLAAHKALGGDKAKWARWSKSNAGGTKKGKGTASASGGGDSTAEPSNASTPAASGGTAKPTVPQVAQQALGQVSTAPVAKLTVKDLLAVLQRDPHYCRSPGLYRIHNQTALQRR